MTDAVQTAAKTATDYAAELKAANEIVYKHSLELARLKQELEVTNAQQENLLHFISHEIKGYLTKGQDAFAEIIHAEGKSDIVKYGDVNGSLERISATGHETDHEREND